MTTKFSEEAQFLAPKLQVSSQLSSYPMRKEIERIKSLEEELKSRERLEMKLHSLLERIEEQLSEEEAQLPCSNGRETSFKHHTSWDHG